MSADNWTTCPDCVKRAKALREAFVKKYYGKLDSFVYNKILEEVNTAVQHIEGYSSGEYKPSEEILKLMEEKDIIVNYNNEEYDGNEILQEGNVSSCLREDYEQGVDNDGFVYMIYSCSCDCGFEKEANYHENKHKIMELEK